MDISNAVQRKYTSVKLDMRRDIVSIYKVQEKKSDSPLKT